MTETQLKLLLDLHLAGNRQGPGRDRETRRAMKQAGLLDSAGGTEKANQLTIVDIGSGTGSASLQLAKELGAEVTAVDFLPDFLAKLRSRAEEAGVSDKITTLVASMDDLPFDEGQFDVIWSEAAIYNIGFEKGITYWSRFLKPGGTLVVSEISWLTAQRPSEIQKFWEDAYPEINLTSAKLAVLEQCGFTPLGWFSLPKECWIDEYFLPLQTRFEPFLKRYSKDPIMADEATAIVEAERAEIDLYNRFGSHYGYGFYIARKA